MYYFIVNPNSRTGKGKQIWDKLEPLLIKKQTPYKVYFTKYSGHGTKIAKAITFKHSPCNLIALGGDGTVNEVINGIHDFEKVIFSYIPTGSSNDFARGLSLPTKPLEALDIILSPKQITNIDIPVLRYGKRIRSFAVSSGMGFDASICHDALNSRIKKFLNRIKLGKLTYVGIALKQLFLFHPQKMTIILDDTKKYSFQKVYFSAIMNLPYEGGGLKFSPKARADDGILNVCVIEGLSKFKILCLLPTAFFGLHTKFKGVHSYSCQKVSLITESKIPVHTDGESCLLQTSIEAECIPKKLPVITG